MADQKQIDSETWNKYFHAGVQLSPAFILYIGSQIFGTLKDVDPQHTFYLVVGGAAITVLWMFYDLFTNKSDIQVLAGLHTKIEPLDSEAKMIMHNGLHSINVFDISPTADKEEIFKRYMINAIVVRSLEPAVHQNHHGRELVEHDPTRYVERKKRQALSAFSGNNACYRAMAEQMLPPGQTFERVIDIFVNRWIHEYVCEAVQHACEEKVKFYKDLLTRRDISSMVKNRVKAWIEKNMAYIEALVELRAHTIIRSNKSKL